MTGLLQAGDVVAPGESQPGHVVVVGVLVAKQQARRKPKGAKKRDEQSEWCVREREGKMKAGLQIRAASDVIARCCRNFPTPAAVYCCVAWPLPASLSRHHLSLWFIFSPLSSFFPLCSPSLPLSSAALLSLFRWKRLLQYITPNYTLSSEKLQM